VHEREGGLREKLETQEGDGVGLTSGPCQKIQEGT
jgi:hypothetical protein